MAGSVGPASVEVTDVRKTFGDTVAVDGVSLQVPPSQTLALLGPSGCGKTTLLRIIAGLDRPDVGSVRIGGEEVEGPRRYVPAERRRVGLVFQDIALFPHLSVARNVGYGLSRAEVAAGRAAEALDLVRLGHLADRRSYELSGGQAQRVALARALAPRPRVILFDEPFSGLDADLRVQLRAEVAELIKEVQMTAVLVTHDQQEAFALGDRIAVMRDGRLVQQGDASEIYSRPADRWVARFVGEANLLELNGAGGLPIGPVPLMSDVGTASGGHVLIRPEHLSLSAGGEGTVTAIAFHGHDTTYRVSVAGVELLVREMSTPRHFPGDRVTARYVGPATMAYPAHFGADLG
jgi:iron(III) transport system ATP-binding protein